MALTAHQAERLGYIRLLLDRAVAMTREPAPFCFDSINRLHDVADLFLIVAGQKHGIKPQSSSLTAYWDEFEKKKIVLPDKTRFDAFNTRRNKMKHDWVRPHLPDIMSDASLVAAFIAEQCKAIFGVELDDVSIIDFVRCDLSRRFLADAQAEWDELRPVEALRCVADAFFHLLKDYQERKTIRNGKSVMSSINDLWPPIMHGGSGPDDLLHMDIVRAVRDLDFAVMLVGLGVEMRAYGRFKALTPRVLRSPFTEQSVVAPEGRRVPTLEDYVFCRDFVVSTALHLADFDFDLPKPGA